MSDKPSVKICIALFCVVLALLSVLFGLKYASSASFHEKTIKALDEKKVTVMELTAASTAASAAITVIPGDAGTPIADKLADLSTDFLLVICAIFLEKYLLTITGYASFVLLIPAALVFFGINIFWRRRDIRRLAMKMLFFGIALYIIVPLSVTVSHLIETTYQTSIQETIDSARDASDSVSEEDSADTSSESGGGFGLISGIRQTVSGTTEKFENILNRFIEALAVLLVTNCILPILVLFFFVWLTKIVLEINPDTPPALPHRE